MAGGDAADGQVRPEAYTIGVIGGTGPQGKGLGFRLAAAGHRVTLGSRSQERAQQAAEEVGERLPEERAVAGAANDKAVADADVIVLAVPYEGHAELVRDLREHLAGKIVVSCVNPLGFDEQGPYGLDVPEGSAAEQAAVLAPEARVAGAFHHLSAKHLRGSAPYLSDEDVLVVSDDEHAKEVTRGLARAVTGKPGVDAGPLRLACQLEQLIAVVISVNKRYKVSAGLAVTGLPPSA